MSKKIYKIKFVDKEQTEKFVKNLESFTDEKILKEKKKSVIVAAKDKDAVRDMIVNAERLDSHYGSGYCFGEEDEDYFIKKVADSKEEYKTMKKEKKEKKEVHDVIEEEEEER
jgi:hypothetical protein